MPLFVIKIVELPKICDKAYAVLKVTDDRTKVCELHRKSCDAHDRAAMWRRHVFGYIRISSYCH